MAYMSDSAFTKRRLSVEEHRLIRGIKPTWAKRSPGDFRLMLELRSCFRKVSLLALQDAFVGMFRSLKTTSSPIHSAVDTLMKLDTTEKERDATTFYDARGFLLG